MKQLRAIRIMLAALFLVASAACLVIGPQIHPMARAAGRLQILLSAASVTSGVTVVWLLITFLLGRVYCATACPIGTYSDLFLRLRRRIPRLDRPFSYRPRPKLSYHLLWIYLLCVVAGIMAVPFVVEPWNIARNMAAAVNRGAIAPTWATISLGAATGVVAGVLSAILLAVIAIRRGREFCSCWCPLGTALGIVQEHALAHIEIDPDKCISCGHCEDICRAQCVKTVSRYVDASRCVRCFDCVAECPAGAIRFQINRNRRPATPLLRKTRQSSKT
ncbi:MAG: 4Fe-4S binding protein [Muribaculaceae bacterium]|nr:4Fe-4S binding protein [Muribaculaceae bacterium]